jgi:hypothetical protein
MLATKEETMKLLEDQDPAEFGQILVDDFLQMIDKWHSTSEVYDDDLERMLFAMEYEIRRNPPRLDWGPKGTKYFTPSSANSCKRELFHRIRGDQRDNFDTPPHQGRWRRLGGLFGQMLQTDLLFIEKHYQRIHGERPAFVPDRIEVNGRRFPYWEKFAKKIHHVKHNGYDIHLMGQPDGILVHKTGARVGLEIKSKQTTPAATSEYSLRHPKDDHVRQIVAYSIMYGVDDFLLVYGNLCRKGWDMTEEEYLKNPDIRAFHVHVTEADRRSLLDDFASVKHAVETNTPPQLELFKWTFNNFKVACATSLTPEELDEVKRQVRKVQDSGVSQWIKDNYLKAWTDIMEIRGGAL